MEVIGASSVAYDFTLEVPEIDQQVLMELLEEGLEEDGFQSLETGIDRCECSLDEMLSELNSHECTCQADSVLLTNAAIADIPFDWVEMELESNFHGDNMVSTLDWYMDEGGMVGYGDGRDYEQVYIPLWQ